MTCIVTGLGRPSSSCRITPIALRNIAADLSLHDECGVFFFSLSRLASPIENVATNKKEKEKRRKTQPYRSRSCSFLLSSRLQWHPEKNRRKQEQAQSRKGAPYPSPVQEITTPPGKRSNPSITDNLSFARAPEPSRLPMFEPLLLFSISLSSPLVEGSAKLFFHRLPLIRTSAISHVSL
ncbi:hypothetical protein LZ31DRAFT_117497 [Colletotrichum somersetense]|nr:hypothetical protein LZ31DRAFT_117497 [Colletotrichum somersetense]